MRRGLLFFAPLAMLGLAAFITLGGFIVQQLWNALLPAIFGWKAVTFWQALGLLVLCRILFGGFGGRGGSRHGSRWTPEEKARFRQRMRERFGFGPEPGMGLDDGSV